MSLACLLEVDSPLNGHQLSSLIALAQKHAAVRAVSQLLQRGVAVHRPQRPLPVLHRGALTVPHSPTVGHYKHSNIPPQINAPTLLYPAATLRLLKDFYSRKTEIKHKHSSFTFLSADW